MGGVGGWGERRCRKVSGMCGGEERGISDMWKRKMECGAVHQRGSVACIGRGLRSKLWLVFFLWPWTIFIACSMMNGR